MNYNFLILNLPTAFHFLFFVFRYLVDAVDNEMSCSEVNRLKP